MTPVLFVSSRRSRHEAEEEQHMTDALIPEFGSAPPSPEELRRWERAMTYKRQHESANPDEVICFFDLDSPLFADEDEQEASE
jgi:hypothetical protein